MTKIGIPGGLGPAPKLDFPDSVLSVWPAGPEHGHIRLVKARSAAEIAA